jgi:YD repeat-containing protein
VTDALGHPSRKDFDARGNVLATVDARGTLSSYSFDAAGSLRQVEVAGRRDGGGETGTPTLMKKTPGASRPFRPVLEALAARQPLLSLRSFPGNFHLTTPRRRCMRNTVRSLILAALTAGALPLTVVPALAADAVAPAAHYSVSTTLVAKMLDDPATNALLKKMIPTVYANDMFQTSGRELTLKAIQQFEPEALSDENLAKIQAELDKLPAKG